MRFQQWRRSDHLRHGDAGRHGYGSGYGHADGSHDEITGSGSHASLNNVDNTISGAGTIGTGSSLSLTNGGTIDADLPSKTLTVDTGGNKITNTGIFEATNGGTLDVESSVDNTHGSIAVYDHSFADFVKSVTGGTATIEGGTLQFDAASNTTVKFDNGASGTDYGLFVLKDWSDFSGTIKEFTGTADNAAHSDEVELLNFTGSHLTDVAHYNSSTGITTLKITTSDDTVSLKFEGDYTTSDFVVTKNGSTVKIFDPQTSNSASPTVSVGGAGNDTFVFHPGEGAQTMTISIRRPIRSNSTTSPTSSTCRIWRR